MANPSVETFSRTSRDSDARQRSGNSQARSFRDDVVSLPAARAVGRMPRTNRSRCAWTPARQDQNSHPQWGRKTRGGRSKPTPSPARQGRKALSRRHFWSRMWHARAPGKLTQFIVSRDRSTTSVTAEQDDFYESLSPLLTFHVKRDFFSRGECKKAHPCGKGFQKGDRSTRTATISHRVGHDGRHKRCGEVFPQHLVIQGSHYR